MDQLPAPRRRFALSDMLLLFVGLSIGFALMAHFRTEEQRRLALEFPEDAGRTATGPFASIYMGVALGMAFAFPMLRLRECRSSPASRRLRISDVFGLWPGFIIASIVSLALISLVVGRPPALLGLVALFAIVVQMPLGILSALLAFHFASDREGNWLNVFACATNTANGLMVLLVLSSF